MGVRSQSGNQSLWGLVIPTVINPLRVRHVANEIEESIYIEKDNIILHMASLASLIPPD